MDFASRTIVPATCGILLWTAASIPVAMAALMTPAEAEKLGDRLCTPTTNGLLNCEALAAPAAKPGNSPDIVPLPQASFSETFGPETSEAPMRPALDPVPEKLDGRSVNIGWDIGYGTPAEYWEIWDNQELLLRSRQFTQRDLAGNLPGKDSFAIEMLSVQSGVQTINNLADGRHELEIRLCNTGKAGKPVCASAFTGTWVGAASQEYGEERQGLPAVPELGWFPQINTGEAFTLEWHVWWGNPGSYWQVVVDGKVSNESRVFTENNANSQAGAIQLLGMQPGKHQLSVRLCNQLQCAESQPATLEVLLPSEEEIRPVVTIERGTPDSMLLLWSIPQYRIKQAPLQWRLLDGESGNEIISVPELGVWQKTIRMCQAAERARPGLTASSYCGEIRLPAAQIPASIAVEVCLSETECLRSTPRSVSVTPQK